MKTRPLKVGEYRKVKTWDELLATEGAALDHAGDVDLGNAYFVKQMKPYCGLVNKNSSTVDGEFYIDSYEFIAEFFTDDYYDENGNEVKEDTDNQKIQRSILSNNNTIKRTMEKLDQLEATHSDYGIHLLVDKLDPLDQLEATTKQDVANSNKVLDEIALMREIEALQVQCEDMNKLIETKLNELGATHE